MLTGREGLLRRCQLPAATSLAREGNVQIALAALQEAGMSLEAVGLGAVRRAASPRP